MPTDGPSNGKPSRTFQTNTSATPPKMPIDYSKWDKLELSDDSDVEVHPNVDKASFIRWKQQDIHQKRQQRNQDIATFEVQVPMYEELNRRVDQLLKENDDSVLGDYQKVSNYLKATFDSTKPAGVEEDAPTYNEMIEDLFTDLKKQLEKAGQDPNDGQLLRQEVAAHRKKIDEVVFTQKEKLRSLYKERELHISSDDIHTGWDRSFLNTKESEKTEEAVETPIQKKTTASTSATAETGASVDKKASTGTDIADDHPLSTSNDAEEDEQSSDLLPDTLVLSKIPLADIANIKTFLRDHTDIIRQDQKDSLLMSAFDAQFAHDDKLTRQIIGHSILLQYVMDIMQYKKVSHKTEVQQIVQQLFEKVFNGPSTQALDAFNSELESTFQHIKTRCGVLSQENQQAGEQEIQLKSLDDDTELVVNLPDANSEDPEEKKRYELFLTLPPAMQSALKSESLEQVNDVFHGMPIEEAEQILEVFEQTDIIGVKALLENENEWEQLKDQYSKADVNDKITELQPTETADIVD